MKFRFDDALSLTPIRDGVCRLPTDRDFWNGESAFGGWQAAACAASVSAHPDVRGALVSQSMHFHAAVRGHRVELHTRLVERRRTMDFWSISVIDPDDGDRVLAQAQQVMGERLSTQLAYDAPMPERRSADDSFVLERSASTPSWFGHYDIRIAKGRPFQRNADPASATWVSERDGRPLDGTSLLAIVDTPMPRTFFCAEGRTYASTVSLATQVFATSAELRENAAAPVLLDTRCIAVRDGLCNAETVVFRADGKPLAASYQIGAFREP